MKKFIFAVAALLFLGTAISSLAAAPSTTRYATCDACGYCPLIIREPTTGVSSCNEDTRPLPTGNPAPGNWKSCARCLYPSLYPTDSQPNPDDCSTVKVITDRAPTPFLGRQYTMIGCLSASGNVFENTKATGASTFVQAIFDLLVFRVIGGIAFLYLMYGAFLVITSQADAERLNYGRRVIIGAVVGLIFALGSVFIVNLIGSGILRLPGFTSSP